MEQLNTGKALIAKKSNKPVQLLKTGQLLALADHAPGGLIIQQCYHADFIGPGAAVGGIFDLKCIAVYPLGNVEFSVPSTRRERKEAFQKRIAYIEKIQRITQVPSPLRRASLIIRQLCYWYGLEAIQGLPDIALAKLVAVLPETIAIAWNQCQQSASPTSEEVLELQTQKAA